MDAAANRLAAELRVRGVASGAFVAVARGAAADIAIAWIAVLKAGGAYLPIDPELPAERLAYMLEDAKVAHAIADEAMAARLARPGIDVVRPEREAERIAAHAALPPPATHRRHPRHRRRFAHAAAERLGEHVRARARREDEGAARPRASRVS